MINLKAAAFAAAILACAGGPTHAQSLNGSVSASAIGAYPNTTCNSTSTSTAQASCVLIGSSTGSAGGSTYGDAASAQAVADFGVLHANSSTVGSVTGCGQADNCSSSNLATATATATFNDILFVTNAPSVGVLQIGIGVTGSVLASCGGLVACGATAEAAIEVSGQSAGSASNPQIYIPLTGSASETITQNYNWTGFSGSIAVPVTISLLTVAECGAGNPDSDTCQSDATYLNTAVVTGIQVFDTNGNLVPLAVITSASGTNYNTLVSAFIAVPNVVGSIQSAASAAIVASGLILGNVTSQASNTAALGNVISQTPPAGASVADGSAVNLVISSGPVPVEVPNVVGQSQAAASSALASAGLVVGAVTSQSSATVAAGDVISENPAAGTSVASASAVNLVVSSGATVDQQLGALRKQVAGVAPGSGLVIEVATAQVLYDVRDIRGTCVVLAVLVKEVQALEGKIISPQLARTLIADAQAIETAIGCK